MTAYRVVDVFTGTPLEGNPVAVFLDADDLSVATMQCLARETNLSETTFVLRPTLPDAAARVRIFTPCNELPFAGHPLLGTAIALADEDPAAFAGVGGVLALETWEGVVPFRLAGADGVVTAATMSQPLPTWRDFDRSDELLAALGVSRSLLPMEIYRNGPRHVLVTLPRDELTALTPDHRALGAFDDMATNCLAADGERWRMRMFSPAYGVLEDAATGSAAGPAALHLARHGWARFGEEVEILQGVEIGRPSWMYATARGDGDRVEEIRVSGSAVIVARGDFDTAALARPAEVRA